ncbi:E3 ubiquitin-protein ligase RMA3 [Morella rubra]|uniref:E3 ubiquitin-protein ligase RMA n=1 Tax=Morella rubra TaxID=262757 RepID=A0A6A1WAZ0_9ROSI|nr:E3 ubiquitin-protein ligase RMA3 [Morella rubra]
MGEETSDTMNLDLNLGPIPEPQSGSIPTDPVNLDDWVEDPSDGLRDAIRLRARQRWRRWRQFQIPPEARTITLELNQLMVNTGDRSTLQMGEGSAPAEERMNEVPKTCENFNGILADETSEKNDDVEKGSGNDGSFFDCHICLDLARDPVVTCCGHLFCWPCLYRWLHVHSDAKECPVCKGEVTIKSVTPIYGRGKNIREPEEDSSVKIPARPHARRVESLRQTLQRTAFNFPVEEMIRRLGHRFDLTRDFVQPQDPDAPRETMERSSLLNRFLTSRARREQNPVPPPDDVVDLTQSDISSPETGENRRLQSLLLRRTQSHRATLHSLSSALSSAERLVETYFRHHPAGRNQEQPQPVDDRDSFSSIAAVINSESQVDTAMEIDSMVSLSTSSSRRRSDASRASDVDSGDSRAPRRRRLI